MNDQILMLTAFEESVAVLIARGLQEKQILETLRISHWAFNKVRYRINCKLGTSCALEVAKELMRSGLLKYDEFLASPNFGTKRKPICY